jgi:hypothetical protein
MGVRMAWILGMIWLGICPAGATWFVEVESGVAAAGYNDVRIPPDAGTEFSLVDDLEADPTPYVRLRAGTRLGNRHTLFALAAPLRIDSRGTFAEPVSFHGVDFATGIPIDALYRFDSYRLTYRYRLWAAPRVCLELGVTAKVRDAEIRLGGGGAATSKTDTGFVPLLAFAFDWRWTDRAGLKIEGDAAASPGGEGRAEDVFAGVRWAASREVDLLIGYRLLEGGADVETVYNFAMIHYVSLSMRVNL